MAAADLEVELGVEVGDLEVAVAETAAGSPVVVVGGPAIVPGAETGTCQH
jgi:hypothetical protein